MIEVGNRYRARGTATNLRNGIRFGSEGWISHVGPSGISVVVIRAGRGLNLLVPRELFGMNFEPDTTRSDGKSTYGRGTAATKRYR